MAKTPASKPIIYHARTQERRVVKVATVAYIRAPVVGPRHFGRGVITTQMVSGISQSSISDAEHTTEEQWTRTFAASQDFLAELADEALAEFYAGETELLDPDKL